MYDLQGKENHFAIGTAILQAPSQEISLLVQFSVQQLDIFPF